MNPWKALEAKADLKNADAQRIAAQTVSAGLIAMALPGWEIRQKNEITDTDRAVLADASRRLKAMALPDIKGKITSHFVRTIVAPNFPGLEIWIVTEEETAEKV